MATAAATGACVQLRFSNGLMGFAMAGCTYIGRELDVREALGSTARVADYPDLSNVAELHCT